MHNKQEEIIGMFGTVEYDKDYDYKKLRNRKISIFSSDEDFLEFSKEIPARIHTVRNNLTS
ncbi:TPA: hypothetical protein DCR49_00955 [Candidatus Delongbacteria bacterium]|nr:hypothetical protein [Candidatus Delongbacteria bacterium]